MSCAETGDGAVDVEEVESTAEGLLLLEVLGVGGVDEELAACGGADEGGVDAVDWVKGTFGDCRKAVQDSMVEVVGKDRTEHFTKLNTPTCKKAASAFPSYPVVSAVPSAL